MGHGCYYTHEHNGERAFWVDIGFTEEEYELENEFLNIKYELKSLGYDDTGDPYIMANGLGLVKLVWTYDSTGIVIKLEPHFDDQYYMEAEDYRKYNLFISNKDRMYDRIKRHLLKSGYKLRIATSGYTSTQITN